MLRIYTANRDDALLRDSDARIKIISRTLLAAECYGGAQLICSMPRCYARDGAAAFARYALRYASVELSMRCARCCREMVARRLRVDSAQYARQIITRSAAAPL